MSQDQAVLNPLPFELNETDRQVLALTDDDFKPHTWAELKEIIRNNDLAILRRRPSDTVRYIEWSKQVNSTYGSTTNYLCLERLTWSPLSLNASGMGPTFDFKDSTPLKNADDYRILRNDWPYDLAPGITHLVVWLKNRIPTDPITGDLTANSRELVESFVRKTFVSRLLDSGLVDAPDHVLWFKNWTTLQSVRAIDHIHVLINDVPDMILDEWNQ